MTQQPPPSGYGGEYAGQPAAPDEYYEPHQYFTADTELMRDAPYDGSGIGLSLDVGDSEFDPPECADLLNTEASLGVDTIDVAQVTAEGDEPTGLTYTQAVMQLPEPATELASLDPLRGAIESCGTVELSGVVNGAVNLRDIGLPAARATTHSHCPLWSTPTLSTWSWHWPR